MKPVRIIILSALLAVVAVGTGAETSRSTTAPAETYPGLTKVLADGMIVQVGVLIQPDARIELLALHTVFHNGLALIREVCNRLAEDAQGLNTREADAVVPHLY